MANGANARQKLLDAGRAALLARGYDGVGLNAILSAAGVPKGSFYHFFRSKDDFAVAILDDYERHYAVLRDSIFGDERLSPLSRLSAYFAELERIHGGEEPLGGCLFGVLAQTAAARSPMLRDRLAVVFATWTLQIEALLVEARERGELASHVEPAAAAAFLIDAYEGALMRMKIEAGTEAFVRFRRHALAPLAT